MNTPPSASTSASTSAAAGCLKLTSYFGERQRASDGRFAADALLDSYGQHGIAASILLRGVEGFGARHRLRTDRSLTLHQGQPMPHRSRSLTPDATSACSHDSTAEPPQLAGN